MAAPDGRAAAADFDGTPAVYVYCELRSRRLIWYRCACRSTRKRMPRTLLQHVSLAAASVPQLGPRAFAWPLLP